MRRSPLPRPGLRRCTQATTAGPWPWDTAPTGTRTAGRPGTQTNSQWNGDAQSRYHGVLAPNHRWRGLVTPARRGKGVKSNSNTEVRTPAERHAARACPALSGMTWAQRLKRVFNIDMPQGTLCMELVEERVTPAPPRLEPIVPNSGNRLKTKPFTLPQDVS